MQIPRECRVCGKDFLAIKQTQFFCCRKCFKKDYYQRTKAKLAEEAARRPVYNCPICEEATPIDFDPIKDEKSFDEMICPFCGIPRSVMYAHHTNPYFIIGNSMTAQFVVQSAIISGTITSRTVFA